LPHDPDDWDGLWSEYKDSAERNPARSYRRGLMLRILGRSTTSREMRLLDVGSGPGDFLRDAADHFPAAEMLGIELSEVGVEYAKQLAPRAEFLQRDLVEDAEVPNRFAAWATHVVCSEVLEHVDDPVRLLENASAYMADGARIVVTVPGGPVTAFDRHIGHRAHFSRARLRETLEAAGFQVETVMAAGFPFFNLYKIVVLLMGDRVIGQGESPSRAASVVLRVFGVLFRLNLRRRLGWQMVAVARFSG